MRNAGRSGGVEPWSGDCPFVSVWSANSEVDVAVIDSDILPFGGLVLGRMFDCGGCYFVTIVAVVTIGAQQWAKQNCCSWESVCGLVETSTLLPLPRVNG